MWLVETARWSTVRNARIAPIVVGLALVALACGGGEDEASKPLSGSDRRGFCEPVRVLAEWFDQQPGAGYDHGNWGEEGREAWRNATEAAERTATAFQEMRDFAPDSIRSPLDEAAAVYEANAEALQQELAESETPDGGQKIPDIRSGSEPDLSEIEAVVQDECGLDLPTRDWLRDSQ